MAKYNQLSGNGVSSMASCGDWRRRIFNGQRKLNVISQRRQWHRNGENISIKMKAAQC
jgi:hypothetical protein